MAGKIVSFKIGDSVTHVAEVDYEVKNPKVYHAFAFETPQGVIDDEGVHITEEFLGLIRKGMMDNGIQNNRVMFTMASGRVANRDVTIPLVKEAKIRPILISNSREYFPVDLSQYQIVYRVTEVVKAEKQMKLSVFAVPNTLIDSYQNLAKALDMQMVALDYYGNSIYQAMMYVHPQGAVASICIDDNNSMITIVQDGKVLLQRNIGYGIDDAVVAMQNSSLVKSGTTYLDALTQMQMNQCFNDQLRPRVAGGEVEVSLNVRENITRSLTLLIGNISRVLEYFASRNPDVEIDRIALVGLGADCKGLDRLLTNELGVNVGTIIRFGDTDVTRALTTQRFHLGEYYACIGCALKPLNFIIVNEEKKVEKESMTLPIIVCAGCAVVSLAVVLMGSLSNMWLKSENKELQTQIEEMEPMIDTYNTYVTNKVIHAGISMMDANSSAPNDAFLDFLAEMEEKMPSDILVSELSVADNQITMSLGCTSKQSASETLFQLREFDTVYNVECTGITEEQDESGAVKVLFDVVVTYQDMPSEEEAAESVEAQN